MYHHGSVKPYDSRMVIAPVLHPVSLEMWTAYLFIDSCQVPHGTSIEAVLTFLCEDGQYKFIQGLTTGHRALVHRLEEVFKYTPGRAPAPVLRQGETAATCYDAILNFGTYTCVVSDAAPASVPSSDPALDEEVKKWTKKFVAASSSASILGDGFVLMVKGRPPQPFFQASVDTTQFVFSTETTGAIPYSFYYSRENCGLDTLCNDVFLPHAIPDGILSCSDIFFPAPRARPAPLLLPTFFAVPAPPAPPAPSSPPAPPDDDHFNIQIK
jgi:hypothetical protein